MRHLTKFFALFAAFAISASALLLFAPDVLLEHKIIYIIGTLGALLWCRTLWTFFFNRVAFDWHMINGWFLLNVILLALLTPSLIAIPMAHLGISSETLLFDPLMFEDPENGVISAPSTLWSIYFHFADPGNLLMAISSESRKWASILAIAGLFLLNGLLVSSLVGWIDRRKERWTNGDICYRGFLRIRMHHIIIGGNDMAEGIVHHIFASHPKRGWRLWRQKLPWIVIQTTSDINELRRKISASLSIEQQKHLIICHGSRTSKQELTELAPATAKQIFILGEEARIDDMESCHDTLNMECLKLIASLCEGRNLCRMFCAKDKKIDCHVMFEYQTAYAALKVSDINTDIVNVNPFNPYEMWAQRMLVGNEMLPADDYRYLPLEGSEGIKADEQTRVHLIIIGMSRMGISLGIEAAHLSHFPNFATNGVRTRITFIDANAQQEMAFFKGRFEWLFKLSHWRYAKSPELCSPCEKGDSTTPLYAPGDTESWHKPDAAKFDHLGGDFIDVEWEFIHGNVESESVRQYLADAVSVPNHRTTIAICLPIHNRAVAEALHLPSVVYQKVQQVLVYQRNNDCTLREISANNARYHRKLKPFGLAAKTLDFELLAEIDCVANKINEAYDRHMSSKPSPKKHGKSNAAKLWSNRYNAYSLRSKCRCVGLADPLQRGAEFTADDLEKLILVEHNRWNIEQLLLGLTPLDRETQESYMEGKIAKEKLQSQFLHPDISSNEKLKDINKEGHSIDKALVECLPRAIRHHHNIEDESPNEPPQPKAPQPVEEPPYTPQPLDTSEIELPAELNEMVEVMAKNVHEVWAQSRIKEGWKLGAVRDEKRKEHPCLVEYEKLPESERDYDRNTAIGTLKLILKYGAKITLPKR